jgi:hypothetical protein
VAGGCLSQRGQVGRSCGFRGQREGLGGLADLGGELLEAGRDVQREESRGGGGDDVGVAKTPWQDRDGAGPAVSSSSPTSTRSSPSRTNKVSSSWSWTWTGLPLPRRTRLSVREKAPPVCSPLRRTWDRAPRNQMAAWVSGLEITLRITGVMGSVMAGSFRTRGAGLAAASESSQPLRIDNVQGQPCQD